MAIGTGVKRAIFLGPKSLKQNQGTVSATTGELSQIVWQNSIVL